MFVLKIISNLPNSVVVLIFVIVVSIKVDVVDALVVGVVFVEEK